MASADAKPNAGQNATEAVARLRQFRQQLYEGFAARPDALLDLVDALAGNTTARSPVELSLNPAFRRHYSGITDAIDNLFQAGSAEQAAPERRAQEQRLMRLIAEQLSAPQQQLFWLFGLDVTSKPRLYARTLADRTVVHQPNPIRGNRPITIGHQDSVLVNLPEKSAEKTPPWVGPLLIRRVTSLEKSIRVGAEQVAMLLNDATLPFRNAFCVLVVDSAYSAVEFLGRLGQFTNLVIIACLSGKRTVYRAPAPQTQANARRGHPVWYGQPFKLQNPATWGQPRGICIPQGQPDETAQTTYTTRRGRTLTVRRQGWHDLRMRGQKGLPMHEHPFTLIRIQVVDAQGRPVFQRPMWLIVVGQGRGEISLPAAWEAYRQRFDVEHFFRFGKQRLLMNAYQTPDVEHEENWGQLVITAYVQLWLARTLVEALPRPWERYLPQAKAGVAGPTKVQRDFGRIIRQIGTPAAAPKPRGKSPGRALGTCLARRERHPVIVKGAQSRPMTHQST
jgi:hypothetical protein